MATILEGLNKLSGALGGAETATENLEALNTIAGALGGSADAENNADAIANIAENASGGGGGVTVEPLEVTGNGTYTAPDGKAYTPVTVNVASIPKVTITIAETKGASVTIAVVYVMTNGKLTRDRRTINANNSISVDIPSSGGAGFTEFSIISDGGVAREPEKASGTGFITLNYAKNSATVQDVTVTSAFDGLVINI